MKKLALVLAVPLVFALDRASKIFVVGHFSEGESFPVIQNIFHLTRVNNTGAAFGMMKGATLPLVLIAVVCVFFLGASLLKNILKKNASSASDWAFATIIGGALGNLYDRWTYGYVIDFFDFRVWPVFNIADSFITVGAALVIWTLFYPLK